MHRDLELGETRKDLVSKVMNGLGRRKWMKASDGIAKTAELMKGSKKCAAGSVKKEVSSPGVPL